MAFEGVIMRVAHLLAPQPEGGVRVTYRTEVDGPGAAGVGADVSADFPDVLAALKRAAEAPTMEVHCRCGAARLTIHAAPLAQLYCHCDDCRAAHDGAYVAASIHPTTAVQLPQGELVARVVQTTPRMACRACGTDLFSELAVKGPAQRERLSAAGRPLSAAVSHPMPTCRAAGARHAAALPSVSGRVWRL